VGGGGVVVCWVGVLCCAVLRCAVFEGVDSANHSLIAGSTLTTTPPAAINHTPPPITLPRRYVKMKVYNPKMGMDALQVRRWVICDL